MHIGHLQHGFAGLGGCLVHHQLHVVAHHHAAQFGGGGVLGVHGADVFALAQDAHAVGHFHDFVQLMGNEQNGLALLGQPLHDLHQLHDLLGRQHGGGLVENQDFVVAVQHFQDLHALLHSDRDILHLGVQIHRQAVFLRQLLHLFPGLFALDEAQLGVLRAQDNVVQHGKDFDQFKMLVHHADVQRGGVIGVIDFDRLSVLADFTLFRLIQTKQHAHQRGFSRAVFSQQRVDLAPPQLQGDIVVGFDPREYLGNMQHFDHIIIFVIQSAVTPCSSCRSPWLRITEKQEGLEALPVWILQDYWM